MSRVRISFRRISAGHYQLGPWTVRSWRKNEWWLFQGGRPAGRWRPTGAWRRYEPFTTLRQARVAVDGHLLTALSAA
jgi:hypothetical protein